MKSNLKKMSVIAAFILSGSVFVATGCGGHPAYKLKDGESSKVRIIEKDGKLVKLEVNQNAVTEVALAAEDKVGESGCKIKGLGRQKTEEAIKPENELKKEIDIKGKSKENNKEDSKENNKQDTNQDNKKGDKKDNKKENKKDSKKDNKSDNNKKNKDKNKQKGKKTEKGNENKSGNKPAKKKIWVPAVYKTVKHPAVTKQEITVYWVCQCGQVFYSDEDWQAHRPKP
ncbi:hypothetical protein [Catonella massiliensis]|uniref:Lipoprotein n=1 Tax=Catonella massiliensis TaxID=2799636 RepID=A0ABS1J2X8_9FIRM|nr:hypothetical protein [Catonella massiliensis]MBF1013676.1 hypothetical protein [Lachnospiraceae bacterium]MBK5897893.1 hypothetical protein [Catonella massiliensis]